MAKVAYAYLKPNDVVLQVASYYQRKLLSFACSQPVK